MRAPPLLLSALLAGCVASVTAGAPEHDVLTLTSGERLVGDILDVNGGRYEVLLTDGRTVTVEFRTVSRVEMGRDGEVMVAPADLPLPSWAGGDEDLRPVGVGFDFGLQQGARVRLRMDPAVAHIDLKLGAALLFASGFNFALLAGGELAFIQDSVVRPTLSVSAGPAYMWGSILPFVGVGTGLQIDPRGPFEFHLGLGFGTTTYYFSLTPELGGTWVW